MVYVVELDVGLVGTTVYSVVYDINKSRWRRFFHVRKASILEANDYSGRDRLRLIFLIGFNLGW